jgi:hypothetical protein
MWPSLWTFVVDRGLCPGWSTDSEKFSTEPANVHLASWQIAAEYCLIVEQKDALWSCMTNFGELHK